VAGAGFSRKIPPHLGLHDAAVPLFGPPSGAEGLIHQARRIRLDGASARGRWPARVAHAGPENAERGGVGLVPSKAGQGPASRPR